MFLVNNLLEYLFSRIILYTYYNPLIPNKTYFVASSISIPYNTILYLIKLPLFLNKSFSAFHSQFFQYRLCIILKAYIAIYTLNSSISYSFNLAYVSYLGFSFASSITLIALTKSPIYFNVFICNKIFVILL